jgi:adenosylcobinamide-phosphate synthase
MKKARVNMARAGGIALGIGLDHLLGDPRRFHPVAGFGRFASLAERRLYRDSKPGGVAYVAAVLLPLGLAGVIAERVSRKHPALEVAATGLATWTVLCGTSARRITREISEPLIGGDIQASRDLFPKLFYRSSDVLADEELATVLVFGVTESLCDAEVAPLLWGAVGGIPGLLLYRGINVLDNKIGYRSDRYRRFGWAAARLDDVANYVPARVAAALTAVLAPGAGGRTGPALQVWSRDAAQDSSPNSGQLFAAFAGAFRLSLTKPEAGLKPGTSVVTFGTGTPPLPEDLPAVIRLSALAGTAAGAISIAIAALSGRGRRD